MCCYTNTRPRSGLKNTCSPCKLHRMFVASLYQKTPTLAFPSFGRLGPHSNPCTPYCCSLFFWRREIIFIECKSIFLDSHLFGPNTLWLQTLTSFSASFQSSKTSNSNRDTFQTRRRKSRTCSHPSQNTSHLHQKF